MLPTIVYPFTEGSNPRKARSFGRLDLGIIEQRLSRAGLASPSRSSAGASPPPRSLDGGLSDSENSLNGSDDPSTEPSHSDGSPASLAEKVLVKEWDRRTVQGLFRYDVRECASKVCVLAETLKMLAVTNSCNACCVSAAADTG